MAEWFGGPIMEKLISTGFEYLKDPVRWQTGMKEELERLREYHPKIQAVVFASNQAQIRDQNPALNSWLWQLRDAIDEADDVLDDFEYKEHEKQLMRNKKPKTTHSTMSSMKEGLVEIGKRVFHIDPNLKRLEEVVKKLDKVSADVGHFLHFLEDTKHVQQEQLLELYKTRETGSLPKCDLIGRGKDLEYVMQWLRKPSDENNNLYGSNISLLSIVGLGGMGKTTFLQHVYEDEMTKEFDLKIWVCVSNKFDVKKVIADMLESLKMKRPTLESLDALQRCLKSEVMSKKFLLVLDDIWEEEQQDRSKWENVFSPLACGSLGSKILVTTRMDSAALMIAKVINKKKEILKLQGLEDDDCLKLLNKHAFANVDNPDVHHPKLISISKGIVKKVSGSPLATKVMGGILNFNLDERYWIKILNSDIGSTEFGQNNVMPILRLSYIVLPAPLQNCFAFCSIFPEDYYFDKDDLVRMWIVLGFIQSSHIQGEEVMEDIGQMYFDILVKKSFFDEVQIKSKAIKYRTRYKMHDLLHELAQSVSAQECFRIDGHEELYLKIPETIRYLSITTRNVEVLTKNWKFKNLRSLFLTYYEDDQDLVDLLARTFKDSRSIRLLYINARHLKMLPETIECLRHIRYLKLNRTISRLPRSLSKLYHLQFIISEQAFIYNPIAPDFFPRDMNNLSNLHHLELRWDEINGMYGIGKLHSLQRLDGFYVKNEIGYGLGELEHMNDLRQLRIKLLENVKDDMEACSAKLYDKRNLADLSLEWGDIMPLIISYEEPKQYKLRGNLRDIIDPKLDEKVLDSLQPHRSLKKLRLHAYMGIKSAIWMDKLHLISNLEFIQLDECLEWQILPPFGQLPFLKSLYLNNMPKVKQLGNKFGGDDKYGFFPSIEVLHIKKLEALEHWFDAAAAADDCLFPCLTELYLKDCPNLQELPSLPPKLKKLKIDNIGWKALNWKQSTSNHCCISKSIPLKTLKVLRCPNIICLPLADELAALRNLKIIDCRNLISLSGQQVVESAENCQFVLEKLSVSGPSLLQMTPLRSLTSLQTLKIKWNDELLSFPIETEQWFLQVNSSLRQLNFNGLKSLQSLPSYLSCLSSLKFLNVGNVPQLQQLPTIPASLENLQLSHLNSLQCLPSSLSISSIKSLNLINLPLQKLPDLPLSLRQLYLQHLKNLDSLPSCIPNLSSLQYLCINCIPQLRELPDFPPSLKELSIYCHPELKERCRRVVGSDWHKIAHIPDVKIFCRQ